MHPLRDSVLLSPQPELRQVCYGARPCIRFLKPCCNRIVQRSCFYFGGHMEKLDYVPFFWRRRSFPKDNCNLVGPLNVCCHQ